MILELRRNHKIKTNLFLQVENNYVFFLHSRILIWSGNLFARFLSRGIENCQRMYPKRWKLYAWSRNTEQEQVLRLSTERNACFKKKKKKLVYFLNSSPQTLIPITSITPLAKYRIQTASECQIFRSENVFSRDCQKSIWYY